jgi:putative MATE family efflux protein
MIIAITGALLNIILDYVLIFGYNNLIPAMGIKGAAVASVMAQFVMALLAFIFLYIKTPFRLRLSLPFNPEMKNLVLMIANLFIRTIALNVALYYGSAYATKYGDTSIAAYTISIQIWFFFAFVLDGYSSAGNILSGKLFGGKRYVDLEILGKKLMKYGMVTGIVLGLISAIFYKDIGQVFIKDSDVLKQFYSVFWIVLAMQPINGIAFVFDGVFKGLGYMSYLRNVLLLATFIGFIPTLFLFDYFNFNLYAIWIAFTVWMLIRAGTLWYKFTHLSVFKNENIVT